MTDTVIRIIGQDLTGKAFKSAVDNAVKSYRQIDVLMAQVNRGNRDFNSSARQGADAARGAFSNLGGELASLAGRYVSIYAAVELARKSFLGYAEADADLRKMSVQTGRELGQLTQQMDGLIRKWSEMSTIERKDIVEGFNALREAARVSPEEAAQMFEPVLKFAAITKTSVADAAKVAGALHLQMGISTADMSKAMAIFAEASKAYNIDAQEMLRWGPMLIDVAARFGYTGAEGFKRVMVYVGALNRVTGNTQRSTRLLQETFASLDISTVANWLQWQQKDLKEYLEQAARSGEDVLSVWVGLIDKALQNGMKLSELPESARRVYEAFKRANIAGELDKISGNIGQMNRDFNTMTTGPMAEWSRMWIELQVAMQELGKLLETMGASEALKKIGNMFKQDREDLEAIIRLWTRFKEFIGLGSRGGATGSWGEAAPGAGPGGGPMFRPGIGPGAGAAPQITSTPGEPGKDLSRIATAIAKHEGLYPGSRSWRNNNPGNLKYGPLAQQYGATGADAEGFAKFPSLSQGWDALHGWLQRRSGQSLAQLGPQYTPDAGWAGSVAKIAGVDPNAPLETNIPRQVPGTTPSGVPAPPANVLAQAQAIAAQSQNPGAVQAFMQSQGFPMSGAWCGEFTAAVIRAAGGTPPANPAIASSWRNYGTARTGAPQPGDVAVRRSARTGNQGSHVNIVESYDPETNTFIGIGGNQGRIRSRFPASQYDFRAGAAPAPAAPAITQTPANQAPSADTPSGGGYGVEGSWSALDELKKPIRLTFERDPGETQFRRSSIRREVDKEMRQARWDNYGDIGAA